MRLMVSTFSKGDATKVLRAMRMLSYDQILLVGEAGLDSTEDFSTIERLESLAGGRAMFEAVDASSDFLEMVDCVCEILRNRMNHDLALNLTGGTKLLGDAALFAAFRMGIPAYYVGNDVVRLPVLHGASAEAFLTPLQIEIITRISDESTIDGLLESAGVRNRQAVERIVRELRKKGLATMSLMSGVVHVGLTQQGRDILKWIPEHASTHYDERVSERAVRARVDSRSVT